MRKRPGSGKPRPLRFVLLQPPTRDPKRHALAEGSPGEVALTPDSDLYHFTITEKNVTSEGVIVNYRSLPGNLPATYGNSMALWSSTVPNLQGKPLATAPIPYDLEVDDVLIRYGFQVSNYSVTYQTTGYDSMCALAQVELALTLALPTYVSLCITGLDTHAVKVKYNTLPGYMPATYKNWIGLWQGFESPYSQGPALNTAPITQDATQGEVTIPYAFGTFDYTLIYFLGQERKTAGALLYFQAQS